MNNSRGLEALAELVQNKLVDFCSQRLELVKSIQLSQLFHNNNSFILRDNPSFRRGETPYFWSILNPGPQNTIMWLLHEHFGRQDNLLFENFIRDLCISICHLTNEGVKSQHKGIDLEFEKDEIIYLVAINTDIDRWFALNLEEVQKNFHYAKDQTNQAYCNSKVVCIHGFCYGNGNWFENDEYKVLYGKSFWETISGSSDLFEKVIKPIRFQINEADEEFWDEFLQAYSRCSCDFLNIYWKENSKINWTEIYKANASV